MQYCQPTRTISTATLSLPLVIPKKIKPVIVGSAEEEPFEAKEVYAEHYNPSVDPEEDEDETDDKPQLLRGVSRSFKTVTVLFSVEFQKLQGS